jgi:uncharacterized membrane protein YoaK (UPF0700 family)
LAEPDVAAELAHDRARLRDALLISLTFATGVVDAVSYLGLGQIFTANMTGNTVFLAIALGHGNVLTAGRSVVAIAGFAAGALVAGRRLEPIKTDDPWPLAVTQVLYFEAVFVAAFVLLWAVTGGRPNGSETYGLIVLSSFGMGMQSAAGRKLAVPGVSTNVLTMAMTGLMAELAAVGISGPHLRRWTAAILAMGSGAALGAVLLVVDRPVAALPTLAVLAAVCAVAARRTNAANPARSPG